MAIKYESASEEDLAEMEKSTENRSSSNSHALLTGTFLNIGRAGKYALRILPLVVRREGEDVTANAKKGIAHTVEVAYLRQTKEWAWGVGTTFGSKEDPLVDHRIKYYTLAKEETDKVRSAEWKKMAERVRLTTKHIVAVIDRDDPDSGVKLCMFSNAAMKEIYELMKGDDGKPLPVTHSKNGRDIRFKTGKDGDSDFTKQIGMRFTDPCPLHPDDRQAEMWLGHIADHPIRDQLVKQDAASVAQLLKAELETEEEGDDDKPSGTGSIDEGSTSSEEEKKPGSDGKPEPEKGDETKPAAKDSKTDAAIDDLMGGKKE